MRWAMRARAGQRTRSQQTEGVAAAQLKGAVERGVQAAATGVAAVGHGVNQGGQGGQCTCKSMLKKRQAQRKAGGAGSSGATLVCGRRCNTFSVFLNSRITSACGGKRGGKSSNNNSLTNADLHGPALCIQHPKCTEYAASPAAGRPLALLRSALAHSPLHAHRIRRCDLVFLQCTAL